MSQERLDYDYSSVKPYEQGRRRSKRSQMWSAACEQYMIPFPTLFMTDRSEALQRSAGRL
jgi:hypothetical protein